MAEYTKIELTFIDIPVNGEFFQINIYDSPVFNSENAVGSITFSAKDNALSVQDFTIGSTVAQNAENLKNAINNLYLGTNLALSNKLISSRTQSTTVIDFTEYGYYADTASGSLIDNSRINVDTTNGTEAPAVFELTGTTITAPGAVPCDRQRVAMQVDNAVYPIRIEYYLDFVIETKIASSASEMFVDVNRSIQGPINLRDDTDAVIEFFPESIKIYKIETVLVEESAEGAGVQIIQGQFTAGNDLPLQYSLDGTNYQSSNSFSGILAGNYTAYMRDSFNCVVTKDFTVEALDTPRPDPLFVIEKVNPLRFVESKNNAIDNVENTLYNNQSVVNLEKYYFRQPFKLGDVVRTQIKTSYRDLTAKVIDDCTGEVVETITPILEIENIGQTDKRDARVRYKNASESYVYFPQGNVYNPDTDEVIDSYFSRGPLPSFARVGMLISFQFTGDDGGPFKVKSIEFNNEIGYWCLIISYSFVIDQGVIATSIYNAELFDIYEFSFTRNKGQYRVEIEATDTKTNYPDILSISEPFFFGTFKNVVTLQYYSDNNQAGINYQTGIQFLLNVPGRYFNYSASGDDETFEDDYGNRQIQKSIYVKQLELQADMVPAWLAEKIIIASGQEFLFIDEIESVMTEKPEVESMSENNNPLYRVTGIYQVENEVIRDERTGIVSSTGRVIGADDDKVLGL